MKSELFSLLLLRKHEIYKMTKDRKNTDINIRLLIIFHQKMTKRWNLLQIDYH